jgi:hypothetical protein
VSHAAATFIGIRWFSSHAPPGCELGAAPALAFLAAAADQWFSASHGIAATQLAAVSQPLDFGSQRRS